MYGATSVIIFFILTHIQYQIEGKKLVVFTLFKKWTIPISEIKEIKKNYSRHIAPACHFDRLEIFYGEDEKIYISPKDVEGLVRGLLEVNPQIRVDFL
ncbi:PH domain-containing protein [Persicobacter psychrovividus]|uniref:PH domain-containing protein n=1 Tax=Persicobacter psychrovividus TaxID=387638 RepID=UPI003BABAAF2